MSKSIGKHRKGNPNDNFGFINNHIILNLFIHDNQFRDDISRYKGQDVFVTFKVRKSIIKKGSSEGYEGSTLENEQDIDFLIEVLQKRVNKFKTDTKYSSIDELCKQIIIRLSNIPAPIEKVDFFKNYFIDTNLSDFIRNHRQTSKFSVMKFGLQTFFNNIHDDLEIKINEVDEDEILRQMGFHDENKYDVLTHLFFSDFKQFEKLFFRFPENVNKEFIYKIILESETLPFENSFESIKAFVNLINLNSSLIDSKNAFNLLSNLSTPKIRLYLWLNDLTDLFDFNEYKENIWSLERKDQSRFIKKIFYWKSIEKADFTLKDLMDIKVFNIKNFREVKKAHPEIDYINLDFNVSLLCFLLNSISELNQFNVGLRDKLFEYFLEYVQDYKEIQRIDYFYPKCKGRTTGHKKSIIIHEFGKSGEPLDIETFEYNYYHNNSDKPLHHNFCDGQLDVYNNLGFPSNKPYSWCTGLPCFDPSISKTHLEENYFDWTIVDFMQILNIPYEQKDLAFLLGYINKANLLIDRLKCHGCDNLLRPTNPNMLTSHVINNFQCTTPHCSEYNKKVYLNSCLNKNCINIIDSRISKQCKHQDYSDYWGWTICDSCYSCCETHVFNRTIERRRAQNKNWKGPQIGHDQSKQTFCYHCGEQMNLKINYYLEQQKIVKNIENSTTPNFVLEKHNNHGQIKFKLNFNELPFIKREKAINTLKSLGFKLTESWQNNIFYVERFVSVLLTCSNAECPNEELFTPTKPTNWKLFKDKHPYYIDAVKNFFETEGIEHLENI